MAGVRFRGAPIPEADTHSHRRQRLINQAAAERFLADQEPLGQRIAFWGTGRTIVGVYGVLTYSVAQRTREIGIRVALRASSRRVMAAVVGPEMLVALLGVGLGLLEALGLSRVLRGLLYGISTTDAGIFLAVALLLGAVSLLASYLPARRATRVDPMIALRAE